MERHHHLAQLVALGQHHPVYAGRLLLLAVAVVVPVALVVVVVEGLDLHTAMVVQAAVVVAVAAAAVAAGGQGLVGSVLLVREAVAVEALVVTAVQVLAPLAVAEVVAPGVGPLMAGMAVARSEEHRPGQHHGRVERHLTGPVAAVAAVRGACSMLPISG